LLRDADKPHIFCTYSIWESEAHLENYRNSALFKEVWKFTKSLFLEKPVAFSAFCLENV
jgi:heme-degrading monooxygenase HmoA